MNDANHSVPFGVTIGAMVRLALLALAMTGCTASIRTRDSKPRYERVFSGNTSCTGIEWRRTHIQEPN